MRSAILRSVFTLMLATSLCVPHVFAKPHQLIFDASESAPIAHSEIRMYQFVVNELTAIFGSVLKSRDTVKVTTFGESSPVRPVYDLQVRRANEAVYQLASITEALTKDGLGLEKETRLWGYFALNDFDCEPGSTVVMVTDGVPSEISVNQETLFSTGSADVYPAISPNDKLSNCDFVFVGVGMKVEGSYSTEQQLNLQKALRGFVERHGAASVRFLLTQ